MGDYFNLPQILSLILLIFFPTACLLGALTRCKEGCYVAGILRFFLGWNILWIVEIVLTITHGCQVTLLRFLKC